MKKLWLLLALPAVLLSSCAERAEQTAVYANVIPTPNQISCAADEPGFRLTGKTAIAFAADAPELANDADRLKEYIDQMTGLSLDITNDTERDNVIRLRADLESDNLEGYVLTVSDKCIDIDGASPAGVFYGIQTLRKSIPAAERSNVTFPAAVITDQPRFAYRGAMLDVSRHFFPADSVKKFIDMIALHNINNFHWHLSDDQGWRIQIDSRPLLTEIGSKRPGTVIGHNTPEYDSIPVEGFYTKDEIRDIIKYAADRYINIVPEIDLPGHMLGAISSYPYLGCGDGPYQVWQKWGVSEDVLCAGNDSTYKFLEDVLGEVADLFPSEYIHIGGDECPKTRWKNCPKCQAKIAALGLVADEHASKEEKLQGHVVKFASDFLASKGKKIIGWDEILEGGAAPGAVIMSWRGEEGAIAAAKSGHDAIMTPTSHFYFDYYQTRDIDNEPMAIGGFIPLEKVYAYDPVPAVLTDEESVHILGAQANLWTEYIADFPQVQYMELPRMAALSELQWSTAPKDYNAFMARLPQMFNHYKANGLKYSLRAFDVTGNAEADTDHRAVRYELATGDGAPVYYTLDGSEPSTESALYTEPLMLTATATVRAKAIRDNGFDSEFVDSVAFSKATGQPVTLLTSPEPRYALYGPGALVDGKFGKNGLYSGGWMGFKATDMVAVVDLGEPAEVSSASVNTCVSTTEHVFDATGMTVYLSDNGTDWKEVAAESFAPLTDNLEAVNTHTLAFDPQKARYVKIAVGCLKANPDWHPGKGMPSFVFIDEITIR